ncbi:protein-L-isoaspartate O-methyltransferase [Candidatus Poribacteria bacterium]|nr:MAG: protein-L-isoaspartate O-methyltransferase [Candidatus Poribacteria bacterium]
MDYATQRQEMVQHQLENRGIRNPQVLAVMRKVKRHLFVTPENVNAAYQDSPLRIAYGQTISQPYIVALMTELLALTPTSKVLEIGTGCGYQTAVLAELAAEVYSVEILPELADSAKVRLTETLNYQNIRFKLGDGHYGWQEHAPYDAILVAAAPKEIPQRLVHQLGEGGRLAIPVGDIVQHLLLIQKTAGETETQTVTGVNFVPMTGVSGRRAL